MCGINGLGRMRAQGMEVVPSLLELLDTEEGRSRTMISLALEGITGEDLAPTPLPGRNGGKRRISN
jgi:hypothetical protein